MSKLLLVDDDDDLNTMMKEYLEGENFHVTTVTNGEAALEEVAHNDFALIVLDVMMPGMNGVEVLTKIRAQSLVPVLMLTGRGDEIDRIIGLEMGADDYVPKPCTPREIVARIRAILRRTQVTSAETTQRLFEVGELSLWPEKRQVQWYGLPLDLTSTEFNLLEVLAQQAGKVVSKIELSEAGLGRPLARYDRSIDVHMSNIRQKLSQLSEESSCIETIRGVGYQLVRG